MNILMQNCFRPAHSPHEYLFLKFGNRQIIGNIIFIDFEKLSIASVYYIDLNIYHFSLFYLFNSFLYRFEYIKLIKNKIGQFD